MLLTAHDPEVQLLLERLGVPSHAKECTIRIAVDCAVEVECVYYPNDPEDELITKRYRLEPIEDDEVGNQSEKPPQNTQ